MSGWSPRQESNLYLALRRHLFYPLNYGEMDHFRLARRLQRISPALIAGGPNIRAASPQIRQRGQSIAKTTSSQGRARRLSPCVAYARYEVDPQKDYGEERYRGFGYIDGRLHMVAFTFRDGTMRVISLRKANPKEVRDHEQAR
jgi:hypothetical protein